MKYPINLDLTDKKVLIIGGGKVAARKLKRLIRTKANIILISPEVNPEVSRIISQMKIEFVDRKYKESDIRSCFLVVAATDDSKVNKEIALTAKEKNILVNVVDNQKLSNFTSPAVINRGELLITIATGGNAPALSRELRKKLENELGEEFKYYLQMIGKIRKKIKIKIESENKRREIFSRLADLKLVNSFKKGREKGLRVFQKILREEFNLQLILEDSQNLNIKILKSR